MKIQDKAYISRTLKCASNSNDLYFRSLSEEMKSDASKATRIQIVSGYFGEDYVLELLKHVPPKKARACSITMIFGYDSIAELLYGQIRVSDLKNKIASLGFKKANITIQMFKDKAPLHTKLYGFLITTRPVWYIGSANLSKAIEG